MNKMNKFLMVILKSILIIMVVAAVCLVGSVTKKIIDQKKEAKKIENIISINNESLINNIKELKNKERTTTLQEITEFEWDEVYQFLPYADPEAIVGKKNGVEFWMSLEGTEEENILFLKNGVPVCYIFGSDDELGVDFRLNNFSENKNYFMYKKENLHTLLVDSENPYYVGLYVLCDEYKEIFPNLFANINEDELEYSSQGDD